MTFLFAQLPAKNCLMTEEQLCLWQRGAIFECECDNLINQHIEADDRQNRLRISRRRRRYDAAIDAAISTHGLRLNTTNDNNPILTPPLPQNQRFDHNEDRNVYAVILDASYTTAMRRRGLNMPRRDP